MPYLHALPPLLQAHFDNLQRWELPEPIEHRTLLFYGIGLVYGPDLHCRSDLMKMQVHGELLAGQTRLC
jgi:hypothetical protein